MTWDWSGTDETNCTTAMSRFSFDTNVLIYSIDLRFPEKHAIAKRLIRLCGESNGMVALQCLNEFYRASTRKKILATAVAFNVVQATRAAFEVALPSEDDLLCAMGNHQRHGIQFFDGLLCATVERSGCTTLFSEDFQDGQAIDGVTIRNPFAPDFDITAYFPALGLVQP
jgi:predicted nucleic acid-binding protein